MAPAAHAIRDIFSLAASIERYRTFESSLALVQAEVGIIPREAGAALARCLERATVDEEALERAVERTGYPIAPLVRQLTAQCGEHGAWLHWGATTQDVLITVRAQQINAGLRLVGEHLVSLIARVCELSVAHRETSMPARCFGGHAGVTTFGLHCATWLAGLLRHADRLIELLQRPVEGELFGAVGTLASMGADGLEVQRRLMSRLGLRAALASASSARDASAEAVLYLALLAGTLAKIAQDTSQLTSTEIGEVAEPPTGGSDTSSTLPHKSNPVLSWHVMNAADVLQSLSGLALRSLRQDQNRSGIGMLEHEVVPQAFSKAERCIDALGVLLAGLQVYGERMRDNCDITRGLSRSESVQMALAPHLGRLAAHDLVHQACMRSVAAGESLCVILGSMTEVRAHLDDQTLTALLSPQQACLGATNAIVDRCVEAARSTLEALRAAIEGAAAEELETAT